jgi:hypothetical protein
MSGEERAQRLSMLKKHEKALFPETDWAGMYFPKLSSVYSCMLVLLLLEAEVI